MSNQQVFKISDTKNYICKKENGRLRCTLTEAPGKARAADVSEFEELLPAFLARSKCHRSSDCQQADANCPPGSEFCDFNRNCVKIVKDEMGQSRYVDAGDCTGSSFCMRSGFCSNQEEARELALGPDESTFSCQANEDCDQRFKTCWVDENAALFRDNSVFCQDTRNPQCRQGECHVDPQFN